MIAWNFERKRGWCMSEIGRWLKDRDIEYVETIVADFAGIARGKILPASGFGENEYKLPFAVFGQTINGTYYLRTDNVEDRDMVIRPNVSTLRIVPWSSDPTASVIVDCYDESGKAIEVAPRAVLQRILSLYAERDWRPVVAPEVEFYLESVSNNTGQTGTGSAPVIDVVDPYGIDRVYDLETFFRAIQENCSEQRISIGAVSQELGPSQFEVNFTHGEPMQLADDVFHFKRTVKRIASKFGMRATFLAKLDGEIPGSSLHIHQSVYNAEGGNIFSNDAGDASELFYCYLGGLQKHLRSALLLLAPYPNSYRRFLSYWSSPVNLEWDIDNRTVGLRVPRSGADNRRIENRLAGSDVNPYLAIAASLACGYLGMIERTACRPAVTGSAYKLPFALHRQVYEAIDSLRASDALRAVLGDEFVSLFASVKETECRELQQRIPAWEREGMATVL